MEKQETVRKQGNVMKTVKKKSGGGVGADMRKKATHGVTDEVMIGNRGRRRQERERGRR